MMKVGQLRQVWCLLMVENIQLFTLFIYQVPSVDTVLWFIIMPQILTLKLEKYFSHNRQQAGR